MHPGTYLRLGAAADFCCSLYTHLIHRFNSFTSYRCAPWINKLGKVSDTNVCHETNKFTPRRLVTHVYVDELGHSRNAENENFLSRKCMISVTCRHPNIIWCYVNWKNGNIGKLSTTTKRITLHKMHLKMSCAQCGKFCSASIARMVETVYSIYGFSQWETTLPCNVVSQWLKTILRIIPVFPHSRSTHDCSVMQFTYRINS